MPDDAAIRKRWLPKLAFRKARLALARVALRRKRTTENVRRVRHWRQLVGIAERVLERHQVDRLTDIVAVDGTPVFRGLALMLEDAKRNGWSGRLNSADRRQGVPERYGKLSQAALYAGWIARKAGFNPANPPGRSTHELRSDAKAYRGPVGRPLAWWQLGLDLSDADGFDRVVGGLGYRVFRPYPSGSEAHHRNLRESPTRTLRRRGLA